MSCLLPPSTVSNIQWFLNYHIDRPCMCRGYYGVGIIACPLNTGRSKDVCIQLHGVKEFHATLKVNLGHGVDPQ